VNLRRALLNRWSIAVLLLAIAAGGGVVWLRAESDGKVNYRFAKIARGDVVQTVSANGTLNPVVLVSVGTQVSGTVRKLRADFNDHVVAGQVLLELDPALLEAQVRQGEANLGDARATLDLARINEKRSLTLWDQDSIARQDVDTAIQASKSANAKVEQLSAQLAKDRTNLAYSVIRSPVSGVVVNRTVDVGQTVAASFQTPTLFQIAQDLRRMQIDTSFAEADVGRIRVGQPVQFTVDAFPDQTFAATVRQIRLNATTQQNVVTYDVVIGVDNPDEVLMPGMTAYVNVSVARHPNVLVVPNAALRFRPSAAPAEGQSRPAARDRTARPAATVYVLDQGKPRAVNVGPGISDGRVTEISGTGLAEGTEVIVGTAQAPAEQGSSTLRMRLF
jgi:HlyD family secretion protein